MITFLSFAFLLASHSSSIIFFSYACLCFSSCSPVSSAVQIMAHSLCQDSQSAYRSFYQWSASTSLNCGYRSGTATLPIPMTSSSMSSKNCYSKSYVLVSFKWSSSEGRINLWGLAYWSRLRKLSSVTRF